MEFTYILHSPVYKKHIQEQTDILTHRKVGRPDLGTNMEKSVRSADRDKFQGQTGRKKERVSDGWKVGRCSIYVGHRQRKSVGQR